MSMINVSKQFDDPTLNMLRACRAHTLLSYEAYTPFGTDRVYKLARLHFDGIDLDLTNVHEELVLGPDYAEEQFAVMGLDHAGTKAIWCPPGKQVSTVEVGSYVSDVLVVVDTALLSKGSRRLNQLRVVQAVLFEDPAGNLLSFDRDIWSDEYLTVRTGTSVSTTTRDFRGDFVAEPPFGYTFSRDILRLSSPHS